MISRSQTLYEQDFVAWCEDIAAKLKARDLEHLDFENLIEEVECLGRSERRELKNRLTVLVAHLLKRVYVKSAENFNGWELTILEQRRQIKGLLQDSPSLKPYFKEIIGEVYGDALEMVRVEYQEIQFPKSWQFELEVDVILSKKYWEDK